MNTGKTWPPVCDKCKEQHCKTHHMKEVGEVITAVKEAAQRFLSEPDYSHRVWIGSGEDFPPEVVPN